MPQASAEIACFSSLEELRPDWTRLADGRGSIFLTWEWISTWWRHFGGGRELMLVRVRWAGETVAVVPLYVWRTRPVRLLRLLGHGPGDELGPVFRSGAEDAAAAAMRFALAQGSSTLLLAEQLDAASRLMPLLGGQTISRGPSPVLRAPNGWNEYLASRSRGLREQLGRRERALTRRHRVRFHLTTDPEQLGADLDQLFRLHRLRWRSTSTFGPEAFHREFARIALRAGWLRLWFLELDGQPAAAWYGFRFGDTASYYQAGRDPAYERVGVGTVLLAHSIREALSEGAREYRFGRGGEPFKYRFATHDPGVETRALASGLPAAGVLTGIRFARRLSAGRAAVRRLSSARPPA